MEPFAVLTADLSSRILTIGPEYKNHRGGVGAVINIYNRYFEVFNFVSTHKVGKGLYKCSVFTCGLINLVFVLSTNKKIEIVHIHGASYGSFYRKLIVFILGKYVFGKKVLYHIHGGEFPLFYRGSNKFIKKLISFLVNKSDVIICLSEFWERFFMEKFKPKRISILPNIIDFPERFDSSIKPTSICFLFLGYIGNQKGIFDLLRVIINEKERYKNRIRLFIGGEGETKHLRNIIQENKLEDIVEYIGWIQNSEKISVLNKSDIYILPSYNEGLPISILEAMSYGEAIISTRVGGIPEIVKHKKNGLLIEPGNLEQLKNAIDYFIEQPELIKKYGSYSEKIIQEYLPSSVIAKLTDLYKSVLSDE